MSAEALHRLLWGIAAALIAASVVLPYLLRVPPRTARDRRYIVATLMFIAVLLGGFAFLR
jgi:hypothetical protein